jgi:hypothetical protein
MVFLVGVGSFLSDFYVNVRLVQQMKTINFTF